jgi:protein-tyrosine phosphatase
MHPKAYKLRRIAFSVATLLSAARACAIDAAQVTRLTPERIEVSWTDGDPVDLYVSAAPDAEPGEWRLLESEDHDGHFEFGSSRKERVYFLLRDKGDQSMLKVAERELPLEHSSNFRDLGGYPVADRRHVRWGRVYRSGASALLSDADVDAVDHLGVTALVDLRSTEVRSLAPTRLTGIPYRAPDYSMRPLVAQLSDPQLSRAVIMERLYREWPLSLAAQFREVFDQLLASPGPVLYNCSAGQDRTGVATALVLSALGATPSRPGGLPAVDATATTGKRAAAHRSDGTCRRPRSTVLRPLPGSARGAETAAIGGCSGQTVARRHVCGNRAPLGVGRRLPRPGPGR